MYLNGKIKMVISMNKYENMTIEELKKLRKEYCTMRTSIENRLDDQAYGDNISEEENEELVKKSDRLLEEILKIDRVYDEKSKNIKRR